jgi:hypothetical protein
MTRKSALLGAIAIACLAGCGDSNDSATSTTQTSSTQTTQTAPKATKRPVPAVLTTVESGAEDTIDFANARNRAKVVATARKLRRVAEGNAAATLRRAGVPEDVIAALKDRAQAVDALASRAGFLRIALGANQVSALMPELYARYKDRVPPAVLKLDYVDREAQLRSRAGDDAAVAKAVDELSSTWTDLRPRVIEAGGRGAAADFSRHVRAMERLPAGSDRASLQKEARTGLELVDVLEGVFREQ